MRAKDFLSESDSGDFGKILTAVSLLHNKIVDGELTQQIPTGMVIRYIKNTGITNFSYADLLVANDKEPALKNLIKNINPDTITFTSDTTQNITNPEEYIGAADNPEQTVSNMAKSAMKRRQN
jgi:hypothetical protein